MSETTQTILEAVKGLEKQGRLSDALALLDLELNGDCESPELWLAKGRLLTLVQREDEAFDCLQRVWPHDEASELVSTIGRYAYARMDLARKLHIDDPLGKSLWAKIQPYLSSDSSFAGCKLSAVLIVRNEESNLERCLNSLVGKVDEIVVVDTGSTDGTLAIAEKFGAVTGFFEWCDDFSAARNASLDLSTGDWNLWIDADEAVDEKSWPSIWEAIIRPHFGGYFVPIVNFTDEEENCEYTHAPIRLFRADPSVRFENKIHEQIAPSIDRLGWPTATLENARLYHYGYKPSEMEGKHKIERTIKMLEKQIEENPDDAFHWFNLANAYSVARRYDDASRSARECLDRMDPCNSFGSLAFQLLQGALNSTDRAEEAFEVALEAKAAGHFTILNQFELAHTLLLLRRLDDALTAIDACMSMSWPVDMTGDRGIVTHKSATLKAQILTELGRHEDGLRFVEESLYVDPNFGLSIFAKAVILERLDRTREALECFRTSLQHPSVAFDSLIGIARTSYRLGDFDVARDFGQAALDADPTNKEAWVWWTKAIEEFDLPESRLIAYETFTDLHGPHADVLTNWGRVLLESGELEAAALKFQAALQEEPANANAWLNMGDLLYKVGQYEDAVQAYDSALRIEPNHADAWFCLGNAAANLGAWEAARSAYIQALSINPHHEKAPFNLSVAEDELRAA